MINCQQLPPVTFWLPKPMIVYSSLLRYLASNKRVDLKVVYFGRGRTDLFDDGETGARSVWSDSLLDGYPSEWCSNRFLTGFRAAWERSGRKNGVCVLAGTQHAFLRGFLAAAWLSKARTLLRYDARLDARYGSRSRDVIRSVALRLLFARMFRLGYTGQDTKRYLLHYGAKNTQVLQFPYVVDHDLIRREVNRVRSHSNCRASLGLPPDAIVVLAALKFNERESPLDVIDGFARAKHPSLRLILVGDGPLLQQVKARVKASRPDRVILPGFLPYTELLQHYAVADIFVHPAHREVWGVSVNEAMVAGLTVVSSDAVGSARELVRTEQNGLVYPAGDVVALARTLDRLASDSRLRLRLASAGMETIEELAPKCIAQRIEALAASE